jgi:hypothetical protein
MGVDTAEALEIVVPGGAQRQSIANALAFLIRTGDHIKGERKVGGSSGHRTDHGKIAFALQCREWRWRLPTIGH